MDLYRTGNPEDILTATTHRFNLCPSCSGYQAYCELASHDSKMTSCWCDWCGNVDEPFEVSKTGVLCPACYKLKLNIMKQKDKAPVQDTYTEEILRTRYTTFKAEVATTRAISLTTGLPIRCQNPPEDITENIVKFVIRNFEGDTTCEWAKCVGKKGDLVSGSMQKEIKAFMSSGPSSFGPRKVFDRIYFLDLRSIVEDKLVVWSVNLTNESSAWKNIRMNASETFADQCAQGRRPHISWEAIRPQIADHVTKLYEGSFEGIFTPATVPVSQPVE